MADKHTPKRIQVDKTKTTLLAVVAGASIITVFALMASKTFFSQSSYLNRVAGAKEKALQQLKDNKKAAETLTGAYKTFASSNPNALGGNPDGTGEKDGDNGKLVLDALPSKYDFPALTASIEKLLTGYTINSISGNDETVNQDGATDNQQPVPIPFSINVGADYQNMQALIATFERSIRPFQILSLDLSGTNSSLQAEISVQTFYQPEKSLTPKTEVIK